jgi:hypothetical protein
MNVTGKRTSMPDSNSACSFVTASTFWSTSVGNCEFRMMCFWGKQPTVVLALIDELFEPLGAHDCWKEGRLS